MGRVTIHADDLIAFEAALRDVLVKLRDEKGALFEPPCDIANERHAALVALTSALTAGFEAPTVIAVIANDG